MFQLHDRTRRRICIAGFFLLCIAPTALVAGWCVMRNLPGRTAAEARRLSRELGLNVSLGDLSHPRPGVAVYQRLELTDAETGRTLLRCATLKAEWIETAGRGSRKMLVLIASQPIIEADGFDRLGQLLCRILQRQTGPAEINVWLKPVDATLRTERYAQTLTELEGRIESLPDGVRTWGSFRLAGVDAPKPVRIHIARRRSSTPPAAGFEFALDTGGAAVPCNILALGLPILQPLGSQCRFRGHLSAKQTPGDRTHGGWDGEISGNLFDVDLGSLVSRRFGHRFSGTGQVLVESARFRRGRLEEVSGELAVGPGEIGRSLIGAAVEHLRLVGGGESYRPNDSVPYQQLAVAFLMDSQGLRLQGRCSAGGKGAVLIDRYHRLLSEPAVESLPVGEPLQVGESLQAGEPLPVASLLRMLVPAAGEQVPATREANRLMRYLPLPQAVAADPAPTGAELFLGRRVGGQDR